MYVKIKSIYILKLNLRRMSRKYFHIIIFLKVKKLFGLQSSISLTRENGR